MDEKLTRIINGLLKRVGKPAIKNIKGKTSLRDDLGFDSFDLAELTVRIEDAYGVDIFEDGLVDTVDDILEKLSRV